jgi:hypothetical protein
MTLPYDTCTTNRAELAKQRYFASQPPAAAESRPADNVTGKEVVTRSSKRPLVVKPPLEATPKELSDHRADTHRKLAHLVSDKIAYATGPIDGVVDAAMNATGELIEDGAFFASKVFHGVKHGWARGKFPGNQDQ